MTASPADEQYLVGLLSRLQRFPRRREGAKRVETLKQLLALVKGLQGESLGLKQQCANVLVVFPEAEMSASSRQLQSIQAKANALLRLLTTIAPILDANVQPALIELRRAVQGASSSVDREWSQQVATVVSQYERLSEALRRTGVTGSAELISTVGRIRGMVKPPKLLADARRMREEILAVGPTLARLGLEGSLGGGVGGFLTAVGEGRGDAKALLDPDVRAFLDKHGLWNVLAVSFR